MTQPGDASSPPPPRRAQLLPPPPLTRVELTFEYTFEELQEGLTTSPDAKGGKAPPSLTKGLLGWVAFIAMASFLFAMMNRSSPRVGAPPPPPGVAPDGQVDAVVALLPSATVAVAAGIFVLVTALATIRLTSTHERKQLIATRIIVIGLMAVILLVVGAIKLFVAPSFAGQWFVDRTLAVVFAIVPWVGVLMGAGSFIVWINRANLRRQWASKPYLRRRRTVVLDAIGEQSADEMTTMIYRWPYFRRAFETPNCLVLIDESELRHVLPKRAMDQPTLERARAVISNHVADCKFQVAPGGFPVTAG